MIPFIHSITSESLFFFIIIAALFLCVIRVTVADFLLITNDNKKINHFAHFVSFTFEKNNKFYWLLQIDCLLISFSSLPDIKLPDIENYMIIKVIRRTIRSCLNFFYIRANKTFLQFIQSQRVQKIN